MPTTLITTSSLRIRGKRQRGKNILYFYSPLAIGFLLGDIAKCVDEGRFSGLSLVAVAITVVIILVISIIRHRLYRGVDVELEWTVDGRAFAIIHPGGNYEALDSQLSWSAKYRDRKWFQSTKRATQDYLGVGLFDEVLPKVLSQTRTKVFRVPLVRNGGSSPQMIRPETSYWTVELHHNRMRGLIGRTWVMKLPYVPPSGDA